MMISAIQPSTLFFSTMPPFLYLVFTFAMMIPP